MDQGHIVERGSQRVPRPGVLEISGVLIPPTACNDIGQAVPIDVARCNKNSPPGLAVIDDVPLPLVHISVLARVAADLAGWLPGRQWAGILNIVGLIAFFVSMRVAVGIGTAPARETEPAPGSGNDTK